MSEVIGNILAVIIIAAIFVGIPGGLLVLYIRRDDAKTARQLREIMEAHDRFMREQ